MLAEGDPTLTAVEVGDRTNSLFLWARSWADSDGNGLPDWWELQNFGYIGVDAYGDPDGDGWNNLQEFQNGTNPNRFDTPPPPQAVTARLDSTGTQVTVAWETGGGPVDHYEINGAGDPPPTVNNATFVYGTSYAYNPWSVFLGFQPGYSVTAHFTNGSQATSEFVPLSRADLTMDAALVRGWQGRLYLVLKSPPADLSRIVLHWLASDGMEGYTIKTNTLSASNLINGYALEVPLTNGYSGDFVTIEAFGTNGGFGIGSPDLIPYVSEDEQDFVGFYWADQRVHLKENLRFLLRSATMSQPFSYYSGLSWDWQDDPSANDAFLMHPEDGYGRPPASTDYEYYGFHTYSPSLHYSFISELRPIKENHLWRNLAHSLQDFDAAGNFTNDVSFEYDVNSDLMSRTLGSLHYVYEGDGTETPLPLPLNLSDDTWSYYASEEYLLGRAVVGVTQPVSEIGVYLDSSTNLVFGGNTRNCYGLGLSSLKAGMGTVVNAGSSFTDSPVFLNYQSPDLQTMGYYFASQTADFAANGQGSGYAGPPTAMPGSPNFSVTNTSAMILTSVGHPITVSGWAKMAINNGYPGKFAYLEQYFDKAYAMDANGVVTTNEAGVVSPYGDFLPTMPGPVALVTMPDLDTGQRGTGVVNVVKLQLDVNHDGVMDLSFGGPDNTSEARPFVFWVNNDNDGTGVGEEIPLPDKLHFVDYTYGNVRSQRNLEDFARLWICGVPTLPSEHYWVELSINASSDSPAINLYRAYETNGGVLYLSDTNVAYGTLTNSFTSSTVSPLSISPGNPYVFPPWDQFGSNQYFLFEGAGVGSGELVLTVHRDNTVIAQTSAFLDLHDVRDLYEQAVITNQTVGLVTNWLTGVSQITPALAGALGEDTNIIIYAHGNDNGESDWLNASATIFKRLYWTGFRGRFSSVHWPSPPLFTMGNFNTSWVNKSEVIGYRSGLPLKDYATDLQSRFPGFRLHMWAHSGGGAMSAESLRLGAPFATLILSSISLPASCFDANAPAEAVLVAADAGTPTPEWRPMGFRAVYTNLTGRVFNYFNTNDDLLISNFKWFGVQHHLKPDSLFDYRYDGTNSYGALTNNAEFLVTDTQESRAMVSRSRTAAIGAQGPVSGQTRQGVIESAVDLHAQFGLGESEDEHGGFFHRPIQTIGGYYRQVLDDIRSPQ